MLFRSVAVVRRNEDGGEEREEHDGGKARSGRRAVTGSAGYVQVHGPRDLSLQPIFVKTTGRPEMQPFQQLTSAVGAALTGVQG